MSIGTGGFDLTQSWTNQTAPVLGPQIKENVYRWATVTDDTPLQIQLDGDSLPLPLVPETLIENGPPPIGSRVWVQLFGRRVIVLGASGGLTPPALTALGAWTTYTPTWVGVVLGSGALNEGWSTQLGKLVHWGIRVEFGTTPSFTSTITVGLPALAYTGGGFSACVGSWVMRDNSNSGPALAWGGSVMTNATNGSAASFAGGWTGATPSQRVAGGVPFTIDVGDVLSATGTYRAA